MRKKSGDTNIMF